MRAAAGRALQRALREQLNEPCDLCICNRGVKGQCMHAAVAARALVGIAERVVQDRQCRAMFEGRAAEV